MSTPRSPFDASVSKGGGFPSPWFCLRTVNRSGSGGVEDSYSGNRYQACGFRPALTAPPMTKEEKEERDAMIGKWKVYKQPPLLCPVCQLDLPLLIGHPLGGEAVIPPHNLPNDNDCPASYQTFAAADKLPKEAT